MDQKPQFAHLANSGKVHISDLCHDVGISRNTGYKYLNRYAEHGAAGLKELSRRPRRWSHRAGGGNAHSQAQA